MRVPLTFRTIWKIDALIILIGGVGVCLMTGYAGFEFLQSRFRPYQKEGVVTVEGHAEERWGLGNFLTIPGAGCMVAPLNSVQSYSRSLNEKDLSAVRNYLFLNVQDKSTRWLTPKHDRLILSMEWMAADGSSENKWDTDKKPVKWLIFQVVPSDTDGDGRWDVRLVDGDGLLDLLMEHYQELDPKYQAEIPLKRVYIPEPAESADEQ